jgi:WD40 repeat protein
MPRTHHRCFCILCMALGLALALLLLSPETASAQKPAKKGPLSFINDVAPIFKENCFACHDSKKRKGKLNLTTYETLRKGGIKEIDPITPGKPEESLLIDLVSATDKSRMPPPDSGSGLPKAQIDIIRQWIKEGAKLDAGLTAKSDLIRELRLRWTPPVPPAVYPHPVQVTALAFTPDGKQLVTGGNHELTVWNVADGKLVKRVRTRSERAYAMLFMPDGKLVVAGGRPGQEGDIRVYDLNGSPGKMENGVTILDGVNDKKVMIKQLLESEDSVLCLDATADGKTLVSGGCDRLVNVWDLSGGYDKTKPVQTIENHADWVFGVALSPDGNRVFSASRDKTAKIWDLKAKESVATFPTHQNIVYGVAVSRDGKTGFSVGEDGQLRQWRADNTARAGRSAGIGKPVFKVAHSPKEAILAVCGADGNVRLINASNASNLRSLSGLSDWVYSLAFSPDGSMLAAGSFDGEVRIWKTADGSVVRALNASPGYQAAAAPKK